MDRGRALSVLGISLVSLAATQAFAAPEPKALKGSAAYGGWRDDAPGVSRRFEPGDIKAVDGGPAAVNRSRVVKRPEGAKPKVPDDVSVELFASGLDKPRLLRLAPNGDLFMAESGGGRVLVFEADEQGKPDGANPREFARGLERPYGLLFHPAGADPRWLYVAESGRVVRYAYKNGDTKASGKAETIVDGIPSSGHWTRDLAPAPDGKNILLAVGSASNVADGIGRKGAAEIKTLEQRDGLGAPWGAEERRATVLWFGPEAGGDLGVFATGLRNCTGLAVHPTTRLPWCTVNERDGLGDDVPFEYATSVKQGAFYGWPWYYIGANEDPRRKDERPDLKSKVTVPDVLLQPHSAPLGIAFYGDGALPARYKDSAFVAYHGSWNRANRTGYKVVRLPMPGGKPSGEAIDFMTGFVVDDEAVWGRPVGVAVAKDGSLIVSEDGSNTLWRVTAK